MSSLVDRAPRESRSTETSNARSRRLIVVFSRRNASRDMRSTFSDVANSHPQSEPPNARSASAQTPSSPSKKARTTSSVAESTSHESTSTRPPAPSPSGAECLPSTFATTETFSLSPLRASSFASFASFVARLSGAVRETPKTKSWCSRSSSTTLPASEDPRDSPQSVLPNAAASVFAASARAAATFVNLFFAASACASARATRRRCAHVALSASRLHTGRRFATNARSAVRAASWPRSRCVSAIAAIVAGPVDGPFAFASGRWDAEARSRGDGSASR